MTDIQCKEFDDRIDAYLRSKLTEQQVATFEAHLKKCAACARLFEQHLETSCREFVDAIADFLEGTLDESTAHRIRRHLEVCPDCRAYLDNYKQLLDTLKAPDDAPPPPPGLIRAIARFRTDET